MGTGTDVVMTGRLTKKFFSLKMGTDL
jgi:hypothetical protein